jgi:multidrug resistance protein MdtO
MAPRASDAPEAWLGGPLRLLQPRPGRWAFAVRLAIVCMLTILVAEIYQTPEPALTTYIAFFVMKPDRMESIVFSIVLSLLIAIVIGLVFLLATVLIDQPAWRVAGMAILSFCLVFLTSASKLRPVGNIIALIAVYALEVLGTLPGGELATRGLLYAFLFVGIPAGVCIVVNLLVGPAPRRLLERALADRLSLAAAMLRQPDSDVREEFTEALSEGVGEIGTWLKLAAAEKTSRAQDIAALRQATQSIMPILLLVEVAAGLPAGSLPHGTCDRLADTLAEMASILRAGGYPIDVAVADEPEGPVMAADAARLLAELKDALAHFAEPSPAENAEPPAKQAGGGFFLPDAFTNPRHVQYALKTTAAAIFCYVAFSLLDWPGIHTCLITCYIVALQSTAETVEKLTLRILGCLIGAAAGLAAIVYLVPGVTSIGTLMAIVFLAALVSGWVAAGGPRISYAGFQIAFAFFLCVIQGSSPAFDLSVARDRIVGILFGDVVAYLVFTTLWPVSIAQRIDPALAALLRRLGDLASASGRSRSRPLAAAAQAAVGALAQDIELAAYEPRSLRPSDSWLELRRETARRTAALVGLLLARADDETARGDNVARRLAALADVVGRQDAVPRAAQPSTGDAMVDPVAAPSDGFDSLVALHLHGLEQALTGGDGEHGTPRYAPA